MSQVTVCQLLKLGEKGKIGTAKEVSPQHRLVEVSCRVADGEYVLGAELIGTRYPAQTVHGAFLPIWIYQKRQKFCASVAALP